MLSEEEQKEISLRNLKADIISIRGVADLLESQIEMEEMVDIDDIKREALLDQWCIDNLTPKLHEIMSLIPTHQGAIPKGYQIAISMIGAMTGSGLELIPRKTLPKYLAKSLGFEIITEAGVECLKMKQEENKNGDDY